MVGGLRPLLPDRPLLPGRGPARRPAAGVHADRPRDVVRRRRADVMARRRADGRRPVHQRCAAGRRRGRSRSCSYAEAMLRYGTDRPDLRVELELADFSELLRRHRLPRVRGRAGGRQPRARAWPCRARRGAVAARARRPGRRSRPREGARGLTWIRIGAEGWQSPAVKFLADAERERLTARGAAGARRPADPARRARGHGVAPILSRLRLRLGERLRRASRRTRTASSGSSTSRSCEQRRRQRSLRGRPPSRSPRRSTTISSASRASRSPSARWPTTSC